MIALSYVSLSEITFIGAEKSNRRFISLSARIFLARLQRGYLRREQRVAGWLVTRGVPAGAATAVLWIVKLAVLGMLLYTVSWLALLLAVAVVVAWLARNADADDEDQPEWREGHSGHGLYDKNEWRHDMGDSDES